ncbi:MAG: ABC transporter ATP-binding protein [Candidatus Aminicenantes bacterium]|nr:ABC transporter ATP-binding protein [Candidatus Aminicenantes bacterium]
MGRTGQERRRVRPSARHVRGGGRGRAKRVTAAIRVEDLRKVYSSLTAVDGISFDVAAGEIFGVVGPNGAGKTTTIECLEGLRTPDGGSVRLWNLDPARDGRIVRERIGVQLQNSALPEDIRVWEALDLFSSYYRHPVPWGPLLERLGIAEKRRSAYAHLSGGEKQRLSIALALINDPDLVFLDELTTGLDPQARRSMWDLVRDIRRRGRTVFLTTHFMEEAEQLCDRVLVMDRGRIVALDSPENLVRTLGGETQVLFTVDGKCDLGRLEILPGVKRVAASGGRVTVTGSGDRLVALIVNALDAEGVNFRDLRSEHPNLEDVFLAVTGEVMRD